MAGEPLDPGSEIEHFANALILRRGRLHLGHLVARLGEGHAERRPRRDQLRQPFDIAHLDPQRARDVAESGTRFQRPERDDLADGLAAVALPRVLENLAAALEAKIEIDIRHRDAFGMRKAYAMSDPAAEPRPGPTGMPRSRAALTRS